MDPLIKSQLLYQLSYTPVPAPATLGPGGEGAENTQKRGVGKARLRRGLASCGFAPAGRLDPDVARLGHSRLRGARRGA